MNLLATVSIPRRHATFRLAGHTTLLYAAVLTALAIPVLLARVPVGVDDLAHLARIAVRAHIATDPDLARLYAVKTGPIPYLGMDLLLTPVARVMPIMLLGRLYILALAWGLVGTVAVLQRVFTGRTGRGAAAAGLIAYNGLMAWGFINYLLGLILALLVFAAWHAQRQQPWLTRLIVFTAAATVLYLTHLLAFVLYGVLVASYELFGRPQPWRTPKQDWLVLAGQAVPALLLFAALTTRMPNTPLDLVYVPLSKLFALESPFLFGDAAGGGDMGLNIIAFGCAALALGFAFRHGWLTCPRLLAGPILTLLALTLIVPFSAWGVAVTDNRFALAAACLALAGLRPAAQTPRRTAMIAAILALLMTVHVANVSILMHRCDGQYAEVRDALALLPRGAELTSVLEQTDPKPGAACTELPIYDHIAQLVTIDRSGYASDFFARVTSVAVRDGRETDVPPRSAETFTTAPAAGYVLWIHLGRRRPPPAGLTLIRRGSFFDLWAVAPQS